MGLFRLIGGDSTLPEPQRSYAKIIYASNGLWDSLKAEADALPQTDAEVEQAGDLRDRPLLIIAATKGWTNPNADSDEARQLFNTMQQELLPLSTNSAYREVAGAAHGSLVMEQQYAGQVAGIVEVVDAVQNGTQLAMAVGR